MCSESVEITPNLWCGARFAEDMKMSCRHYSRQAQYFVRVTGAEVEFPWRLARNARSSSGSELVTF